MDLVQGYSSDEGDEARPNSWSRGQTDLHGSTNTGPSDADGKCPSALDRHQGRIRSFPHQEGSYATHVFISGVDAAAVKTPEDIKQALHTVLTALQEQLPALQPIPSSEALPTKAVLVQPTCHISLSRVVPIRYVDIDPLLLSLKEGLVGTAKEELSFGDLEVFENDDKTRTFLSLGISNGRNRVCSAIKRVNKAFREHGLQQYYSSPKPHASLLWTLGSVRDEMDSALRELSDQGQEDDFMQGALKHLKACTVCMDEISCKIGQRVRTVWSSKQDV